MVNLPNLSIRSLSTRRQKIYKKTSADGKVSIILSKRQFTDYIAHVEPIEGLIVLDEQYLKENEIYVTLFVTFRYGREDAEVMNIRFARDKYLLAEKIPAEDSEENPSNEELLSFVRTMERQAEQNRQLLDKKLGFYTHHFKLELPKNASHSLSFVPSPEDFGQTAGVYYEIRVVEVNPDDHKEVKKDVTGMAIKLVQRPELLENYQPQSIIKETFLLSAGYIELKVVLNRRIYSHGDPVTVYITVNNFSNKTVKGINILGIQTADVRMISCGCARNVTTNFNAKSGCPVRPGVTLYKVVELYPTITDPHHTELALETSLNKNEHAFMAGSTIIDEENKKSYFGIIVSYSVKVKLVLGALAGEIVSEVPFILKRATTTGAESNDTPGKLNKEILVECSAPIGRRDGSKIGNWMKQNFKKLQKKIQK